MASMATKPNEQPWATDRGDARTELAELFDAHYGEVFGYCLARTGNFVAADDVASETFVQAARWFADGRGARVDRQWLFVVARSRLTDRWRQLEREQGRFDRLVAIASVEEDRCFHPAESIETDRVIDALRALPERQCAALALRYLEEHSVAEVAEAMAVSYRTAESLLARGRRGFVAAWKAQFDAI